MIKFAYNEKCELRYMNNQKYVVVDLETTGHSPREGDRMIQIAMVIMKNWTVERTFTTFIHPGKSIPFYIQDLTNITNQDVEKALPFEDYAEEIYEILQDAIFVAHNADFDLSFLQEEFKRAGLPKWRGKKIDTVELAKIVYPMSLSYKLGDLANDLNIPLDNAHRADHDAMATAQLLTKCWEEILTFPMKTIEQLHKHSFKLKSNISNLLFQALQMKRNSIEDTSGTIYFRQIALKKPIQRKQKLENTITYPISEEDKVTLLSKNMSSFEKRTEQFQMMDSIWETLQKKNEIVIEASTGIGKTIGYLLPSIIYAKQQQKKICISTYTSHLLEQVLTSEVPKIEKVLGTTVHVSLLKGMQNYIDIDIFEQIIHRKEHSYDETLTILQVLVWLSKTETGDLAELTVSGGGQLFIEKIRKRSRNNGNPLDFYERAINESIDSDIIITNHSMLLADLVRLDPIFKDIDGWIIDEAHQFVQATINQEQVVLSYTNWKYHFGQIGISSEKGLFQVFRKAAINSEHLSRQIFIQLEKVFLSAVNQFDQVMEDMAKSTRRQKQTVYSIKQTAFLNELSLNKDLLKGVSNSLQHWIDLAEQASNQFRHQVDELSSENKLLLEQWDYWIQEFKIKLAEWDALFLIESPQFAYWVELDKRNIPGSIRIYKKPIEITERIQQLFYHVRQRAGIVWTSGSLTVPNNERFITEQLGIPDEIPIVKLEAPEHYYRGARTYIVSDMPDIQGVPQSEYIESVAAAVSQIVQTIEGRCFVLFTSQDMLSRTVELIQEAELLDDYLLFAQGVTGGSRMRLLKAFQKFNRSVLFGTNSFWEGVDVPGDGLSAVIIVRLPFTSPDEPTFKAKSMMLKEKGRNAFTHLSLPEAILRFKQGFGRLIRSSNDKGVFIVLDRRIETKSYGKEFLKALPKMNIEKRTLQHMVRDLEHWYNSKDEDRK